MSAAVLLSLFSTAGSVPLAKPDMPANSVSAGPFFTMPALPISFLDITKKQALPFPAIPAATASLSDLILPANKPIEVHTVSLASRSNPLVKNGKQKREGDLFDSVAVPFKRLSALTRLASTYREIETLSLRCSSTGCLTTTSPETIEASTTGSSPRDRLNLVNAAINRSIQYRQDMEIYGVVDRWATPSETLSSMQGDCEDFAILKMAALHSYGFDLQDMSLVVIFDQKRRFYHAVLSVAVAGRNYILDNLTDQIRLDSQLPDYVPLYSVRNGKGFLHGSRDKSKTIAAVSLSDIAPGEGLPIKRD